MPSFLYMEGAMLTMQPRARSVGRSLHVTWAALLVKRHSFATRPPSYVSYSAPAALAPTVLLSSCFRARQSAILLQQFISCRRYESRATAGSCHPQSRASQTDTWRPRRRPAPLGWCFQNHNPPRLGKQTERNVDCLAPDVVQAYEVVRGPDRPAVLVSCQACGADSMASVEGLL